MWFLTAPGYLIATAMFAGFHAVAAVAAPTGTWRVLGRPAAHTLAEALRFCFPFGGVPLASLAIGQAGGPFASVVRIGGVLLLTWFVFQIGFALAGPSPFVPSMVRTQRPDARPEWHGAVALVIAVALWPLSAAASNAHTTSTKRIAIVQGGGPQGTHAVHTDPSLVFQRHITASHAVQAGSVDMVLWPENVINVPTFAGSQEFDAVVAEAKRVGAPFVVGVTEDAADPAHFVNAQVVVTPDGQLTSRYEKVRRVPFGEYMPMRGFLHALGAPTDLVPRDAVPGHTPAVLSLPDGTRLAVAISWEIFFGGRAHEGVEHGGEFLVNPTNGSSYTWTVLQSQQVASSRLRALEQDRWVLQAAPTGFSAIVTNGGEVLQRTGVSEQHVLLGTVETRVGNTWYAATGNLWWVAVMVVLLLASWAPDVRRRMRVRLERESGSAVRPR
jgi:apolipoprotein N-acyltransferase